MVSESDREKEDRGTETQRDTEPNDYIGFTLRKERNNATKVLAMNIEPKYQREAINKSCLQGTS